MARTPRRCARSPEAARRLLVTVDCGTTSIEPLREAQGARPRRGVDRPSSGRRGAAAGGRAGQSEPAGRSLRAQPSRGRRPRVHDRGRGQPRAARARLLARAAGPSRTCSSSLDLVALGTVADVVPLKGLNRAFVSKGLIAMRRREHVGLTALMDAARLDRPAGSLASRLPARAAHQCRRPHRPRRSRRAAAARGRPDRGGAHRRRARPAQPRTPGDRAADRGARPRPRRWPRSASRRRARVVVTAAEGWHPGVVGLVAARLKERFGRPAFAIALEPGGIGTGSGRSITGVDLGRAVRHAVADRAAAQGRRPRDGGRRDHRAGQRSRRSAPISRRRCTTTSRSRAARGRRC